MAAKFKSSWHQKVYLILTSFRQGATVETDISKKLCAEKNGSCDLACQFSALQGIPRRSY